MSEFDRVWIDERLEAYVDGELNDGDRRRMDSLVRKDDFASRQLRLARMVKTGLADLPWEPCPADVTQAVLATARRETRENVLHRLREAVLSAWSTVLRPSLVVGAFVALIVVGSRIGGTERQEEFTASPEEVERALNEAKWTLAFLSEIGRETGQSIRKEVLEERVARPVQQAFSMAFPGEAPVQ